MRQGEQINNMNERLEGINHDLKATKKSLNSLSSVFGGLKNKFVKKNKLEKLKKEDDSKAKSSHSSTSGSAKRLEPQAQPKAEFAKISGSAREAEINDNLEGLSAGLGRLTNLAKDMSFEMDRQQPIIDRNAQNVDKINSSIEEQNKKMNRVLK